MIKKIFFLPNAKPYVLGLGGPGFQLTDALFHDPERWGGDGTSVNFG